MYPAFDVLLALRKVYHQALQKNPKLILQEAATLQHIRTKVDTFPNPIQVTDHLLSFLQTHYTEFAMEITEKRMLKFHNELGDSKKINHYRDVWYTSADNFEAMCKGRGLDAQYAVCGLGHRIEDIAGITARPLESHPEFRAPRVFIKMRPNASCEQTLKHEDAHAFSMGIDSPEEVYGVWFPDDGEGDMLARHYIDELTARIEANEPLCPHSIPPELYFSGRQGFNRMVKMLKTSDEAIRDAHATIPAKDLSYILRVIPAQIMGKTLPLAVKAYQSEGMPKPDLPAP